MKQPFVFVCLAVAIGTGPATTGTAAPAADSGDPIELFTKMMPVFSHGRCANCHGGVRTVDSTFPTEPIMHVSGEVRDPNECQNCHTTPEAAAVRWRLASSEDKRFYGRTAKQICVNQAIRVQERGRADYLSHLERDPLIDQAFDGEAAGAGHPGSPPMNKTRFLAAARDWLNAGASCGGWEGEITQIEKFASNYSYPMPSRDGTVSVNESAAREVRIRRTDGSATGTFTMSGHLQMIQTIHSTGVNGPCTIVVAADTDWVSQPPANNDVSVRVRTEADGSYVIHFNGPVEKTVASSTGHQSNDCGGMNWLDIPEEPPTAIEWHGWAYTIRCPSQDSICQLFDPDNGAISGSTEETILGASDARERRSWLNESPVGTSRADDGTPIPVKVTTTWDLTLKE